MNQLLELFPVVTFVAAWILSKDSMLATGVLVVATAIQAVLMKLLRQPFSNMHKWTFAAVFILGGASLALKNEQFIQWKLTLIYWVFALVLVIGHFIKKNLIQRMFESLLDANPDLDIKLTNTAWYKLSQVFIFYFIAIGAMNAYVTLFHEFDVWVGFKVAIFVITLILFPATLIGFIMAPGNQLKKLKEGPLEQSSCENER